MDWAAIASAVDFAQPLTVVGAVGLALAGLYVTIRGLGIGLSVIKGR